MAPWLAKGTLIEQVLLALSGTFQISDLFQVTAESQRYLTHTLRPQIWEGD